MTADQNPDNSRIIRIVDDPTAGAPAGQSFTVSTGTLPPNLEISNVVGGLTNWGFFEGSLLALAVIDSEAKAISVDGSAVIVGVGLAVSAYHVFEDHMAGLESGDLSLQAFGIRTDGADAWAVVSISGNKNRDLVFLSLKLNSQLPPERNFVRAAITTRTPTVGEPLILAGFRRHVDVEEEVEQNRGHLIVPGNYHLAQGRVVRVYFPMRDRVLMPYPVIEIAAGSLGGMSGGAVFDQRGAVVGVISRGFAVGTEDGPTFASWIPIDLHDEVTLVWPMGIHPAEPVRVIDVDPQLVIIEGREAITDVGTQMGFARWTDPRRPGLDSIYPRGAPTFSYGRTPGRNEKCWCGSGSKYKRCHGRHPSIAELE